MTPATAPARTITAAPVRRSVHVKATPERAFEVFTARMGQWWIRSHSINASPMATIVMEPRAGGRWYEVGEDGSECPWGHVLAWEPPGRLLLAWQVNGQWTFDPDFITEVEVRFTRDGDGTRVDLEHRNLERFGDKETVIRAAIESPDGWAGLLARFADLA